MKADIIRFLKSKQRYLQGLKGSRVRDETPEPLIPLSSSTRSLSALPLEAALHKSAGGCTCTASALTVSGLDTVCQWQTDMMALLQLLTLKG